MKRFDASAERRYELSILAVMYSVVELHLTVFCAILPRLGYKLLIDWIRENRHRRVSGSVRQGRTIGNFGNQDLNGEGVPLNNLLPHNVKGNNRASNHGLFNEEVYNGRQYNNIPYNQTPSNNRQYGYRHFNERGYEEVADRHRTFQPRTIE